MAHHRERNIAPSMLVSVPRDAVTVSVGSMTIHQSSARGLHPAVQCQPTEETGPMLVSFPISAERNYNHATVSVDSYKLTAELLWSATVLDLSCSCAWSDMYDMYFQCGYYCLRHQ